jgi:ribosomal protein L4
MDTKSKTNDDVNVDSKTKELNEFLKTLNEKERISLEIAKEHLGTSFDYYRCNGFVDWKKKQKH